MTRILIVEDDDDLRETTALCLADVGGMDVFEATGGIEAIGIALKNKPDVILLDVMMPELDGPATLARLHQHPEMRDVPVIFFSAKAMQDEVERLQSMGCAGVLLKPFDALKLPAQILSLVKKHQDRRKTSVQ